jgi:uncharacterized protein YjbI with pentapeptide repeats
MIKNMRLTRHKPNLSGNKDIPTIYGRAFLSCLTFLMVCFIPGIFYAFSEADLARLLSSKECKFCNLLNADLSNAQLSGAQLSNATLNGAKLSNANLSRANLSEAFLTNADLSGANLTDAYLVNASLYNANLSNANLAGANLSGAIWTDKHKCDKDSYGECKRTSLDGLPRGPEGSPSRGNTSPWVPGMR